MKKRCLVFLFVLFSGIANSQFYDNGQNSSAVKWRSIDLDFCEIIFPLDFESRAQELANLLRDASKYSKVDLNTKTKKISIIIQNNTTVANGFVTLAPWRSELYTLPSQENQGVDWLNKLSIHEYRHVIQLEKFNEGVGEVLCYLFGEQGLGALVLATTPLWFIEGDAVSIETINTQLGRGKYGPFIRELKAQLVESDSMSYEKCTFGSYKDYVTDHYKIGYFLVDYIKNEYGEKVVDSLLSRIARNPFVPYPFSFHLKKITGKRTPEIYSDLIFHLKKEWNEGVYTEKTYLSDSVDDFTSYLNPVLVDDTTIICLRKSFNHTDCFVQVKSGIESKLCTPGRYDENSLSLKKGKLVWAEKRRDIRWEYRDYSEIIVYDINSRKRHRLKKRTKWFAPDINYSLEEIVVVEQSKANNSSLVILDIKGEEVARMEDPKGLLYHPRWVGDEVIYVQFKEGRSSLMRWNPKTNHIEKEFTINEPISYPQVVDSGIVFQTTFNGVDRIIYYNSDSFYRVVTPEFGLQFPSFSKGELYYSDYHAQGMRIAKSKFIRKERIEFSPMIEGESITDLDTFEVKKYYPLLHLFNFHSWAPVSIYPNDQEVKLGLSLFSQNKLSSSIASFNYDYDWINKGGQFKANYTFARYFPVFFVNYSNESSPNSIVLNTKTNYKEEVIQGGSRVSLLFDGSKFVKQLIFQGVYVRSKNDYDFQSNYVDTVLRSENAQFLGYYSSSFRRAKRNLLSKWSFSLTGKYFDNLKNSEAAIMFKSTVSTPGLFKNHGLKLSYSDQKSSSIFVANYIPESRGYSNHFYKEARKATADYVFPIVYPDVKLGKLAYVQRIHGKMFYDYMTYNDGAGFSTLQSAGVELNMEFNPFRYSYLTQLGVEVAVTETEGVFVSPIFRILY